jgi:hypothetical protein
MISRQPTTVSSALFGLLLCFGPALATAQDLEPPFHTETPPGELPGASVSHSGVRVKVNPEEARQRAIITAYDQAPVLQKTMVTPNPFNTSNATAIIGRPSWDSLVDSAFDFSNKEGTVSFSLSPILLVKPYPDWYLSGFKLTGSANTDKGVLTFGGKYDLDFTDPRFYFSPSRRAEIGGVLEKEYNVCKSNDKTITDLENEWRQLLKKDPTSSIGLEKQKKWNELIDESGRCFTGVLKKVIDAELERKKEQDKRELAFSVSGNANYDTSDGDFAGATAALGASWRWLDPFDIPGGVVPLTLNLSYEDAIPEDANDSDNVPRSKQGGGGLEAAYRQDLTIAGGTRSIEIGGAFQALGCLDAPCTNDRFTMRINPFLSLAITDSIGGRVDVVWEGNGDDLRSAIAGLSFAYSFSGLGD